MHPNERLLGHFYEAFMERDAKSMAGSYAPGATFRDPVFSLEGEDIGRMWAMLCAGAKDLVVTVEAISADDSGGEALWSASYTFSRTGRPVRNRIRSRFRFGDGLIVEQRDSFGFWRWSRMALGPAGWMLGWTPILRWKVRADAARRLAAYGKT